MEITITTDTNPTGWGDECSDELAQAAAEKLAEMLEEFAREEWPEAEVRARTHHYSDGESIKWARVRGVAAETANEIEERIGNEVERIWTDAVEAADPEAVM